MPPTTGTRSLTLLLKAWVSSSLALTAVCTFVLDQVENWRESWELTRMTRSPEARVVTRTQPSKSYGIAFRSESGDQEKENFWELSILSVPKPKS